MKKFGLCLVLGLLALCAVPAAVEAAPVERRPLIVGRPRPAVIVNRPAVIVRPSIFGPRVIIR